MRTAKSWAEEWSGTTVSSPEDVERFIRRVQADALRHALTVTEVPYTKHRMNRKTMNPMDVDRTWALVEDLEKDK